jgi:hypothetical protein
VTDPLDEFPRFVAEVHARMEAGRATYGDRSFALQAPRLVSELEAEALDLAGWGFVLWTRLRKLREQTAQLEDVAALKAQLAEAQAALVVAQAMTGQR